MRGIHTTNFTTNLVIQFFFSNFIYICVCERERDLLYFIDLCIIKVVLKGKKKILLIV